MHPELAARALDDGPGLAVVVGMGVRADQKLHVLEAQARLVEGPLELAQRAGLVQTRVHQHHPVAGGNGKGVHVRHAGPGQRQAQPPEPGQDAVGPRELPPAGGHGSMSTPGLRMAAGSTAALADRSACAKRSGRWRSYQGRWSRPTAW